MQDQEMIQVFVSYAPQEAFTDTICSWSPKHLNASYKCLSRQLLFLPQQRSC